MKIYPISDMHTEIWLPKQEYWSTHFSLFKDVDVLVIAGDNGSSINNLIPIMQILLEFPHLHVVYVPGNHDYYGSDYAHAKESLITASYSIERLHVLSDNHKYGTWEHENVVFIGATLWTDYNKEHAGIMNAVQHGLNDYRAITTGADRKPIRPTFILNEHYTMKKHIFRELDRYKGSGKTCIVVTHHQPYLPECITDPVSYGYCVDMEDKFNECENLPKYWISGHTHKSDWKRREYAHGSTTFISNQFGYPSEDASITGWHKDFILEV